MIQSGILELDLHGLRTDEALKKIDRTVRNAGPGVYRIRLIHGFNRGSSLLSMIREEYSYGRDPKVIRIQNGWNEGITELVLREL